jgi:1,4-dihydroxy-2-naphthoyl-CoA hydrolase
VLIALADGTGGFCAYLNLPEGASGRRRSSRRRTSSLPSVDGHADARSRPLHRGRTTIVVETDLFDASGRHVARGSQTQAILR